MGFDRIGNGARRWLLSYIFLVLAGLVIGYLVFAAFLGRPKVAIISMSDVILGRETSHEIVRMLRYANDSRDIKAVVLEIDSFGGEVSSTEEVYLNVLRLRKEKPVVAYINVWGVSGAYLIAVASNYIYAKPASNIGNIGVRGLVPSPEEVDEDTIPSGPFKEAGAPLRRSTARVQMIKDSFLEAILLQRKDKLRFSRDELSKGEVYLGMEALKGGLIDALGSSTDAIEKAASYAGIRNYELVDINKELKVDIAAGPIFIGQGSSGNPGANLPLSYYLYIDPRYVK